MREDAVGSHVMQYRVQPQHGVHPQLTASAALDSTDDLDGHDNCSPCLTSMKRIKLRNEIALPLYRVRSRLSVVALNIICQPR